MRGCMKRIGEVSAELDVSPHTIRRWVETFGAFLSPHARQTHRYTDEDIAVLRTIARLRREGRSFDAITEALRDAEPSSPASLARTTTPDDEAWQQVLAHVQETHHTLLNTQLANRDLLAVIVQDNFALKEENARLRRRMQALEEELSRLKESDWNHRLSLEERLALLERQLEASKPWWKRLLGR
ncbi:hypothetical protein ARMA_0707 [Ardenticatena maritima]|uniref:HTH merR-type domain-containing protein n=2 Tax=Ardenticatena maritima TaxID=872965 RepID=A0A0N0RFD0_9CHLR|nr:hypothetical protein ARMA_0707 [Ardenticatena maritima]